MSYLDDKGLKKVCEELNNRFQPVLASRSEFEKAQMKGEVDQYIRVTPYKDTKSGKIIFVYEDSPQGFLDKVVLYKRTRRQNFWKLFCI